jgi:hypothetical protein
VESLKPTARRFVRAVFALLEPKSAEKEAEPDPMPRWQSADGQMFVLRPGMLSPEEWCLIDEAPNVSALPESPLLDAALRSDSRLAPVVGELVGTPLMSMQLDDETVKRELLWAVMRASDGSLRYSEDAFNGGYETWLASTIARAQEQVSLAPVSLQFDGHLDLDDGAAITQLDDDEVSACLTMGAIRLVLPMQGDTAWVRNRAAIRVTYELPRGRQESFSAKDQARAMASETAAAELADEVVEALRVFKRGRVAITGRVTLLGRGAISGGSSGAPPRVPESEELALTAAEAESFRRFWKLCRVARKNRALGVVIRRFSYAGERTRRDDEIVDLIAALEALLLCEFGERGELGFRTALRGALFIEGSGLTRREIKRQLTRGYSVRSAVAHGDEPRARDLKAPNGDQIPLDEFVGGIEELVRLAVRKAVEAVGAGQTWPPDWDGLTLEGAAYPST